MIRKLTIVLSFYEDKLLVVRALLGEKYISRNSRLLVV